MVTVHARDPSSPFELLMLSSLPCGCVAADYRAPTLAVDLIALEVKGPHCTVPDHWAGTVLGLCESMDEMCAEDGRDAA